MNGIQLLFIVNFQIFNPVREQSQLRPGQSHCMRTPPGVREVNHHKGILLKSAKPELNP